jgi:2-keto-4-pentenoate hydratase/2-oxohepta-3-ene-1,7-dioic acid hydratase in catechol pathway
VSSAASPHDERERDLALTAIHDEWQRRFGRSEPKIVCVGLNYRDHAAEGGQDLPAAPLLFAKLPNTICSDGEAIVLPRGVGHVDSEAELAVVIGRTARSVGRDDAYDFIAGYTCANDVSAREVQFADGQWFRGKGYDTFCPLGPAIVPLADPSDLRIVQRLNGTALQDSRTSQLIFDVPTLIEYISAVLTLEAGDLVLTGTPAGVGVFHDPAVGLEPGDVVEVEIESVGLLRNEVR